MTKLLLAALLVAVTCQSALASVDLVQVPIACGTLEEVSDLLKLKMHESATLGKGANSKGEDVAALFSGSGRWALVTRFSIDRVCVVASGRNWTPMERSSANLF